MRLPSSRELCALLGSTALFGCSLIYDLSPDQCGTNADCDSFGEDYLCEEGMCKPDPTVGGDCRTSGDCLAEDPLTPRACIQLEANRASSRECVPLTNEFCPRMLPTGGQNPDGSLGELWYNLLASEGSIVIGAMGSLGTSGSTNFTRNYDLALTELENYAGGVRGTNATSPNVVAVLCNNSFTDQAEMLAGVEHLVDNVRVPAIIAALHAEDLQDAFSQTRLSEVNPDVLFVSPRSSDEAVESLPDDNLVWNILPAGDEVAKAYGPLLTRTITYLRSSMRVPASEDIRVAVLHAPDQRLLADINAALPGLLFFNDKDFNTNRSDGNLAVIQIVSSYQNPSAPLTTQIDAVMDLAPHVIIELGANELFTTIIRNVEDRWAADAPTDQARPFYLMSPYHFQAGGPLAQALAQHPMDPLNERMAGVNYASAPPEFKYVYDDYFQRYIGMWPDEENPIGIDNYYDAPWYVIGALAATTGRTNRFTGIQLADGMFRLQSGTDYVVNPDTVSTIVDTLADGESIELIGVMGRPTFDANGAREGAGSVWCVTGSAQEFADVLRVDPGPDPESPADDTLVGDGFTPCNAAF
jgi:hypothetical protein